MPRLGFYAPAGRSCVMEENIQLDENIQIDESIPVDENIDEIPVDSETADNDSAQLAKALLEELRQTAETELEEQTEEVPENETYTEIDYSEQLSDIYSAIISLRSDLDITNQSVTSLQSTVENQPNDMRSAFDDMAQFNYLIFSLYFGLFIAIIFIMGLKK